MEVKVLRVRREIEEPAKLEERYGREEQQVDDPPSLQFFMDHRSRAKQISHTLEDTENDTGLATDHQY